MKQVVSCLLKIRFFALNKDGVCTTYLHEMTTKLHNWLLLFVIFHFTCRYVRCLLGTLWRFGAGHTPRNAVEITSKLTLQLADTSSNFVTVT
jgi:hypothetical protein